MLIFSKIESIVNELTASLSTAAVQPQVNALQNIIYAYILAWVTVRGYLIIAGKTEDPLKGLIFDAATKMIVVAVVFSPTWISLVTNAIDGLNSWASGSISIYTRLDEVSKTVMDLYNKLDTMGPSIWGFHPIGFSAGVIILIVFAIFAIITTIVIIYATVTLKILVMLTPIMIFTLAFGWLKQLFSKWLELIISNTITILILGILMNALSDKYKNIIEHANNNAGSTDILYTTLSVSAVSIILAWVVLMAKGVAQQLTFVSIEHLPAAAAKEGQQIGGNAARSATKATSKTIGAVSYASRSTADLVASAIKRFGRAKR